MSEASDPVLDALRDAARVQDGDLDTPELRAALAAWRTPVRRTRLRRLAVVGATISAVIVAVVVATPPQAPQESMVGGDARAERFDRAAADFPLPAGQTCDDLRSAVLAGSDDDSFTVLRGTMPRSSPASLAAVVARYSGRRWWRIQSEGTFDELDPQQQRQVQKHSRRALERVLRDIGTADEDGQITHLPLEGYWDALCEGVA